jgi:hypothetical protein
MQSNDFESLTLRTGLRVLRAIDQLDFDAGLFGATPFVNLRRSRAIASTSVLPPSEVGIWDCPNEVAALKLAGCAVSSGDVQVQTLPASKVEDFFKVMSELPK